MHKKIYFSLSILFAFQLLSSSVLLAAPQDVNGVDAACGASCVAEGVLFTTNNTLIIDDDASIGNTAGVSFNPGTNNFGKILVIVDSDISGTIGTAAADSINDVDITISGTDLTLSANAFLDGDFEFKSANQSLILESGANITTTAATSISNTSVSNTGTLTLQGSSTISGNVGASAAGSRLGAINVGANGSASTFNGDVFANTLTVTGTGTINSDSITGTSVIFAGNGTISLDANENITAAISTNTDSTGTLTLEGGNSTITGNVGSASAALAAINVLAGGPEITGAVFTDQLTVSGSGTLNLSGNFGSSAFNTGIVDVSNGAFRLRDNASLFGSITTTVANAGQVDLQGTSTVNGTIGTNANYITSVGINNVSGVAETATLGGNVFANALIQNNNLSTLDIGANTIDLNGANAGIFTLASGGNFRLTINSASVFGKVLSDGATGTATINATNTFHITVSGAISNGQTFDIVTSTVDNITGLPTITDDSSTVSFTISEPTPGDLRLTAIAPVPIGSSGPGQSAYDAALQALSSGAANQDLTTGINNIQAITNPALLEKAVESLDPQVDSGIVAAGQSMVLGQVDALNSHLDELSTQTGVSSGDMPQENYVWFKGYGSFLEQDKRKNVQGYDAQVAGTLLGFDGLSQENLRMGLAGGWGVADVDADASNDQTDIQNYQGTLYARYNPEPWYMDTSLGFGWNEYKGVRHITFDGVSTSRIAEADYDGQQYSGFVGFGYPMPQREGYTCTPTASLHYVHTRIEGYTEDGAGAFNLNVKKANYDLLQSALGAKFSWASVQDWGKLIPVVYAKYLYDFVGDRAQTTASFQGGGASFDTKGLKPSQHGVDLGVGLEIYNQSNVSVHLNYDFEVKEDFTGHNGTAMVKIRY